MKVLFQILGQPGNWTAEMSYLPRQGDHFVLNDVDYYTVHEAFMTGHMAQNELSLQTAGVVLKSTAPPNPIGPGSITKFDFTRLRGLISRHGRCQFELAHAGAQPPEDADEIRKDAETARAEVYAELLRLEKALGL